MKHYSIPLMVAGTLSGLAFSVFLQNVMAEDSHLRCPKVQIESDGCVKFSDYEKLDRCPEQKTIKCFYVPIIVVDNMGHEIDGDIAEDDRCRHQKSELTVKIEEHDGNDKFQKIDRKDRKLIDDWIDFLKKHPEIELVSVNIFGPNYSRVQTNKRIGLIIDKLIESGISRDRIKQGRYVNAKESYVKIQILRIGEVNGRQ